MLQMLCRASLKFIFSLLFLTIGFGAQAQISVTANQAATQLVQRLLGSGITYSNAVLTCPTDASGTFDVQSSNLGLPGGVVLTTGVAATTANQVGMNGSQDMYPGDGPGGPGDPALTDLANQPTNDACILEFDFIPDGDTLSFNYVFGSEEYDAFSCSVYNDVFAFFLSGPGYPVPLNIARIPGTNIPVTINSTTDPAITQPSSLALCTAMGPGSPFAQYYQDNTDGTTVTYYGFTKVLTAKAPVDPCNQYHIKLAIADASDGSLSSGVMIEENSFRSAPVTLSVDFDLGTGYDYMIEGCAPVTIAAVRSKALPSQQVIHLAYVGTATRNTDYFNVPDSLIIPANDTIATFIIAPIQDNIPEGMETIEVQVVNKCNGLPLQSIVMNVRDYLPVDLLTNDTNVCELAPVKLVMSYDPNFSYQWTANNNTQIDSPNNHISWAYPGTSTIFTGSASMQGCTSEEFTVNIGMEPTPKVNIYPTDTLVCLRDSMMIKVDVQPDWYNGFMYEWKKADLLSDPTIKQPKFFRDQLGDYQYVLTVTTPLGCIGKDSFIIRPRPTPALVQVTSDTIVKYGQQFMLMAQGAYYYVWTPTRFLDNPNIYNPYIKPTEPVRLQVIGMNIYGCADTAYVNVGVNYDMEVFIPTAFSPNGDGHNDRFRVSNTSFQKVIEFRIFNRWGQELFTSYNLDNGWDGTYKGQPQPVGNYHYVIKAIMPNGKMETFNGDVTLVR